MLSDMIAFLMFPHFNFPITKDRTVPEVEVEGRRETRSSISVEIDSMFKKEQFET